MGEMTRMVLFTETNSVFGSYFLTRLARHDDVILAAVVLREPGALCDYYLDEPEPLDLAKDAAELDVHTLRPAHINTDEFITAIGGLAPDYFIVANYQLRLGQRLLAVPSYDALNFHPSPLPRYAGWHRSIGWPRTTRPRAESPQCERQLGSTRAPSSPSNSSRSPGERRPGRSGTCTSPRPGACSIWCCRHCWTGPTGPGIKT